MNFTAMESRIKISISALAFPYSKAIRRMKTLTSIVFLCISIYAFAQYPPIPNLPAISPEEVGFNRDSINALDDFIFNFPQNDFRGMVIIKDHKIVIEYFYNNTERYDINDVRSAGKSLTAILLGIAVDEGLVENLDQSVASFFSKKKYPTMHDDMQNVKIKHLLNMASGLDADSDDWKTPGHAGKWMGKDDWVSYLLSIPMKKEAGQEWVYADINSALIGAIIEERSGMSLDEFARKKVFDPLGIKKYYWYTNESNQTVASGTLYLSTLDFAKLGVLVANKGRWAGSQIVSAEYIENLIKKKDFHISELSFLWDDYGMLWYKNIGMIKGKEVDFLWASGNGGNHLVVVPSENMVVALTSTAYGYFYGQRRSRQILEKLFNAME